MKLYKSKREVNLRAFLFLTNFKDLYEFYLITPLDKVGFRFKPFALMNKKLPKTYQEINKKFKIFVFKKNTDLTTLLSHWVVGIQHPWNITSFASLSKRIVPYHKNNYLPQN